MPEQSTSETVIDNYEDLCEHLRFHTSMAYAVLRNARFVSITNEEALVRTVKVLVDQNAHLMSELMKRPMPQVMLCTQENIDRVRADLKKQE